MSQSCMDWRKGLCSVFRYVARILVGVTAPEGTDIEGLDIGTGRSFDEFESASGQAWGSAGFHDVPNGDGLANDLLMVANRSMENGAMPFAVGAEWKLHIVDLWVNQYRQGEKLPVDGTKLTVPEGAA